MSNEPAFPGDHRYDGMTLRDYFAAKAMQGDISASSDDGVALCASDETIAKLAKHWYRIADAMLLERDK